MRKLPPLLHLVQNWREPTPDDLRADPVAQAQLSAVIDKHRKENAAFKRQQEQDALRESYNSHFVSIPIGPDGDEERAELREQYLKLGLADI